MTSLYRGVAIVGLGLACAACADRQPEPQPGEPSSAQAMTYKCDSCGKTTTVAAGAPAPSC